MSSNDFQKHYLPFPCKYCGGGASYAPLNEMKSHGIDVYFCHPCQAEYVVWSRSLNCTSISLYTKINDKTYRLTYMSHGTAMLWHIKIPGEPGTRVNKNLEMVKSFDYHPDATPINFNEKIKTWLVFI